MNLDNIKKYLPPKKKAEVFGKTTFFEVAVDQIVSVADDLRNGKNLFLKFITATDEREAGGGFKVWYIFGAPEEGNFIVPYIHLTEGIEFPSLALEMREAWDHERKIMTFFGLKAVGHPDERPIILHENWPVEVYPLRKDYDWQARPKVAKGEYKFNEVEGEGIYEIPVGPIHAGIIEPGHFRFSMAGEEIVALEPRLGYVHKGSEKLFENLSLEDAVRLSEKISGDSSFGHSLAFCGALEQLSGTVVPERAKYLRVVFAELERLANHFGDIGAMMLDTGFSFGGAHGTRLREIVLQINEHLTGSRFLRGVNMVGGVSRDITNGEKIKLLEELVKIAKDFSEVMVVAEESASLLNRLKTTGVLDHEIAVGCGATGIAAKASGVSQDARVNFPYAAYEALGFSEIEVEKSGDVYARFRVRVREVEASIKLLSKALSELPEGAINVGKISKFEKNASVVSVVEGWRGEIIYFVTTDGEGKIQRVAPRDPSVMNWPVIGYAIAHNIVPDFPLINKSFNLSYSGNDL